MRFLNKLIETPNDPLLTALRIVLGIIFFAHGTQKTLGLFGGYGFAGSMNFFTTVHIPAPLAFVAILAEFAGGIALILGLAARLARSPSPSVLKRKLLRFNLYQALDITV